MEICGIDSGKNGAMVFVDMDGNITDKRIMPLIGKEYDVRKFRDIFKEHSILIKHCYLEKIAPMHKVGCHTTWEMARGYQLCYDTMIFLDIPFSEPKPKEWQAHAHKGFDKNLKAKEKSMLAFKQRYPHVDFRPTPRCRNHHDGLIDALLIAEFGLRACHGL